MAKKKMIKDVEGEEKVKNVEETSTEKIEGIEKEKVDKKDKKESKKKNKKDGYLTNVGKELKKVVWPSFGSVAKYSFAVIIFCLLLCLFFLGVDVVASFVKGLFA